MRCRRARAWRSGRGGEGMVGDNKRMEGRKSRSRPLPGQRRLRSVCNTPSHLGGARLRVRGSLAQPASSRPFSGGRLPAKAIKGSECDIHPVFPQIPAGPGCALPGLPVIRPRPSGGHRVCRGFPVRQVARCIRIASMPLLCVGIGCGVANATDFTIPAASDGNGNTVLPPAGCARPRCALRRHTRGAVWPMCLWAAAAAPGLPCPRYRAWRSARDGMVCGPRARLAWDRPRPQGFRGIPAPGCSDPPG